VFPAGDFCRRVPTPTENDGLEIREQFAELREHAGCSKETHSFLCCGFIAQVPNRNSFAGLIRCRQHSSAPKFHFCSIQSTSRNRDQAPIWSSQTAMESARIGSKEKSKKAPCQYLNS